MIVYLSFGSSAVRLVILAACDACRTENTLKCLSLIFNHQFNKSALMSAEKENSKYIVVDWGTSNFRAFLVDRDRQILDRVSSNDGLLNISGQFQSVLEANIGHWLESKEDVSILMSGMVGSRNGWVEVPYVSYPINTQNLLENLYQIKSINNGRCWIVPGVSGKSVSECFDVMRGEEVQFLGANELIAEKQLEAPDFICMPGTHNKWIEVNGADGGGFSTTMTGELFDILSKRSILSASVQVGLDWDENKFSFGLDNSRRVGGLLHQLFTVRTLNIAGEHELQHGGSYLSGLLIGNEINSIIKKDKSTVAVIASEGMMSRYLYALKHFGFTAYGIDSAEATIAGSVELVVAKEHS